MDEEAGERVTALLAEWRLGDDRALARIIPQIYGELRRLASSYLRRQARQRNAWDDGIGPRVLCKGLQSSAM